MMPYWVTVLSVAALVLCVYLLPEQTARVANRILVRSDQAQLLTAMAAVFAFAVVLLTAYQLQQDLSDRVQERRARAWERLLRPAGGNTGKADDLMYLFRHERRLVGLNLSCETVGKRNDSGCVTPPVWDDLTLEAGRLSVRDMFSPFDTLENYVSNVDFSDGVFWHPRFVNVVLGNIDWRRGRIDGLYAWNATITGRMKGAQITHCTIRSSRFAMDDVLPELRLCDVSGSIIAGLDHPEANFRDLTAWADQPPLKPTAMPLSPLESFWSGNAYGTNVLDRMLLCRPLVDERGEKVPLRDRPPINALSFHLCERMSSEGAMRRFPEAYIQEPQAWMMDR